MHVVRGVCGAAVAALLGCGVSVGGFASPANASQLLYNCPCTGSVITSTEEAVETFTVNQTGLAVLDLAAYDNAGGALPSTTRVGLFDDTTDSVAIAATSFSGLGTGAAANTFVLDPVIPSYALISGDTYSVEAFGSTFTMLDSASGNGDVFNNGGYSVTNTPVKGPTGLYLSNIDSNTDAIVQVLGSTTTPSHTGATPSYDRFECDYATNSGAGCTGYNAFAGGSLVIGPVSAAGATPLPGALPLFVTGLGAFGMLGWRRKKKAAALTSA